MTLLLSCLLIAALTASAQNPAPATSRQPVAMIAGQAIYDEDLLPSAQSQVMNLRRQEYEVKKRALDTLIDQRLLEAEAQRRDITTEQLLQQEVDKKVQASTDAELQAYYLGQKDRLNRPFHEISDQLRETFKQARIQQARQAYSNALRAASEVVILLAPPSVQVGYDPARVRGNLRAPVMIIEFSDFECPFCRQAAPTLKELLTTYKEKVSLAYRDFPLAQIHPQAQLAAEASRCAGEQGKFWEYHDQLFRTSNLSRSALAESARILKLDVEQFDSCLANGKYKREIERDVQEGTRAGVAGTPGFFINGVFVNGAQPIGTFSRLIDDALARKH